MVSNEHTSDTVPLNADVETAYQEALDDVYSFINLENRRIDRYTASKMDASRPQRLMEVFNSPQSLFPTIHIAGTKGKGSVAAICASCLRAAGLRVGLYTSPHMIDFRERIRILTPDDADGRIPKGDFVQLMAQMKQVLPDFPEITWFEIVTAVAFLHFAQQAVDIAVVEVGLGGRLDATNIVTPLVSVITSLSLEHTQLLGNTIEQIAYEKGGIIKPGVPVVVASQEPVAERKLMEIAAERRAPITIIDKNWTYKGRKLSERQILTIVEGPAPEFIMTPSTFVVALMGDYQLENAILALAALEHVWPRFMTLTRGALATGLANVEWPGRLQMVHRNSATPNVLVDCAHNADSAGKLAYALTHDFQYKRLWLVLGATADKDVDGIMGPLLPLARRTIVTRSEHPRAATPDDLADRARRLGFDVETADSVTAAVRQAWHMADPEDLICVTGSIFVVGDLLNQWDSLQSQLS